MLLWSVQFTFADTYSDLNASQKYLFNRASSKLDPIVQKNGDAYRAKLVRALTKLVNQTANNPNIQQVLSALVEHYSDAVQPSDSQVIVSSSDDNSLNCGWPFGDGYTIKQNPYIKSCEDVNDSNKALKYVLFANDRAVAENYFGLNYIKSHENLTKFRTYTELTSQFLGNSSMSISDLEKLFKLFALDKSFFQGLQPHDYFGITYSNPLLSAVWIGKNDKWLAKFLISQGIALDDSAKTELWRIIADYKGNKSGHPELNDSYVAMLEW